MSNFADEQAVTDYYAEREGFDSFDAYADEQADWYDENGAGHWTDETMGEFSRALDADDPWPDYDPDMMPGGTDFLSEPPF